MASKTVANAHLVAAAPDLYEALDKTRQYCNCLADALENSESLGDFVRQMVKHRNLGLESKKLSQMALAKARGEAHE